MEKTISILGCGWLGAPLGESLISKGYKVKGSVREEADFEKLSKLGIEPYKVVVEEDRLSANNNSFFECDVLIISIPPGRKDGQVHLFAEKTRVIRTLIDSHQISKVLFVSSTSVYPDNKTNVREEHAVNPEKPSGRILLEAESVLWEERAYDLTVIRLAGLIGLDRNPLRFYEKETRCRNANAPLNLIHIDDVIGIINTIIKGDLWNETFNACSEMHPTRQEFYELAAKLNQKPAPEFNPNSNAGYKLVNSNKLLTISGYQFKYKSPLDYVREIYG